ncbi:cytochrome P450 [Candidatus Poriferisodalis sp.]|uniref:cytochrome P450 n=1 Tax=Candidatus Poriferisodalis sp. TaxID=3101277 RepID=UPI003B02284D
MTDTAPVEDWGTDYDIFDAGYVRDPAPVWDELRERCPVAHTERWGGSFLPTRYQDVQALAKMVPELSSADPLVTTPPPEIIEELMLDPVFERYGANAAPISEDPPVHGWTRRLLLPHFTQKAVQAHRQYTLDLANRLIDDFIDAGTADAAGQYAQQIPPRVIAHLMDVDESRVDDFTYWVQCILELGLADVQLRLKYRRVIRDYFQEVVEEKLANPDDGFVSALLAGTDDNGEPVDPMRVVGMLNLQLIAGIDTTWSSIGSALWHFGTHPADRERMVAEPELWPTAIEELLRFYSPVTMGRRAAQDVSYGGVTIPHGSKVLMNFPAANRDPEIFDRPDEVILDRPHNRHIAFGAGIHRCAGSNLARLEMDIALRTWFKRIPDFEVSEPDEVTWAGGQVRGPRHLPIRFPSAD